MKSKRPAVLTAAVTLTVISSLGNMMTLASPVPRMVAYGGVVLGLVGLVGAVGLWRVRGWGALVSIPVLAVSILLAAPGIAFATSPTLQVLAAVTVALSIGGIVMTSLPASRHAYRQDSPSNQSVVPTK